MDRQPHTLAGALSGRRPPRAAVVGAGWAGLAAAVRLTEAGWRVTLFEMAPRAGGRARSVEVAGTPLDNGQHILIGAYRDTLALMRLVGVDPDRVLHRQPLALVDPSGRGLRLGGGAAAPAFVRGVLATRHWGVGERAALLAAAAGWALRRFRCAPTLTVAALCAGLPPRLRTELVDPLCVAALNTPAAEASAEVFLRVLRDGLFGGAGASDLLLPRAPLDALLPAPALAWLAAAGAELRPGRRVERLAPATRAGTGVAWQLDDEPFDAVVLACGPAQSAALAAATSPGWADRAAALRYEPIATVTLHAPGSRLPAPMVALASDEVRAPAQFAFDHGQIGGTPGRIAFVVSGAAPWVARGRDAIAASTLAQASSAFPPGTWAAPPAVEHVIVERRATFRCTPALDRPPARIAHGLWAAGDHVRGPYPATLEAAVRSGLAAADGVAAQARAAAGR
ncbi:MAG: hydroxysqualene dehydroxylase HpnE [Rhodoferax sp.]|nr:hydroxysqualene dehydroxylase HpnE [Rhodoferax sp.]MCL4739783.1 hydroxysqualene dehydroxylase HpnE [Burkholderiaceae bacterium]MCP5288652.1 FAD-dependent oxidoreductase [Burkholderiaceae bacterium]